MHLPGMGKIMKKIYIEIILFTIIICLLGGCRMKGFESKKDAEKYVIQTMEEKYNEKFEITNVINYKEEKIGIKWITAKVESKQDNEKKATVYARNTGLVEDNYHIYYFKSQIEDLVDPLCEARSGIKNYEVIVEGNTTNSNWNEKNTLEEYLDKGEYKVDIIGYVDEGKTDDEYADIIYNWLVDLYDSGYNIQLTLNEADDVVIFSENIKDNRLSLEDFTHQTIVEKMNEWRGTSETIKNYEKWKKEKSTSQ